MRISLVEEEFNRAPDIDVLVVPRRSHGERFLARCRELETRHKCAGQGTGTLDERLKVGSR
jgi:hypothetical protein